MADYSRSEIDAMRQEAIRRVNEMHRRSQTYIQNTPQFVQRPLAEPEQPQIEQPKPEQVEVEQPEPEQVIEIEQSEPDPPESEQPEQETGRYKVNRFKSHTYRQKKAVEENTEDTRNAVKEELVNDMINNGVIERIAEKIFPSLKGKIDSEALIIVALIIILAKDGADMKLLVALGYLLI